MYKSLGKESVCKNKNIDTCLFELKDNHLIIFTNFLNNFRNYCIYF